MSTIKELSKYEAYPIYKIPTDGTIKIVKAKGQREPLPISLDRLLQSIKRCNLLKLKPINAVWYEGKLIIFDGWHRYKTAKVQGLEAFFIVVTEDEYDEQWMAHLNSCQQNWKPVHFADMYSKGKDVNKARIYTKFLEYHKRYTVTVGVLVALYNNKVIRRSKEMQEFKDGLLTEEHLKNVEEKLSKLDTLRFSASNPALLHSTLIKQQFQQAIFAALSTKYFSFEKFTYNLSKSNHKFNILAKQRDMLEEIFRIERKK
jgi:hypothetical protein